MTEDVAQAATDGAGIWRDPSGIVQLGQQADNYVSLDHGVTVICDSVHGPVSRLLVRREARQNKRPRVACPAGCGRLATVYIRQSRQQ